MFIFYLAFFSFLFNSFLVFSKKILLLLSLEGVMVSLICLFFSKFLGLESGGHTSVSLFFLVFMVLDSVLGICLAVISSRHSASSGLFLI